MPQIHCNDENRDQYLSVDCKWFKTLVYLYRRNLTVHIENPYKCDLNKLSASTLLVSICFGTTGGQNVKNTNNQIIQIENTQFELKLEPELDQILIEGDTLELGCHFRKFSSKLHKKLTLLTNNRIFLETHLKWFLEKNDEIIEIDANKMGYAKSPLVNIFETNHKIKSDIVIESKLLIKGVKSSVNSGKYFCSTFNSHNTKLAYLNTSLVEISILNGNSKTDEIKAVKPKNLVYCMESITNTFKGSYKWPRTQAGVKSKQKCSIQDSPYHFKEASLQCQQNGQWEKAPNIEECLFESNLTRYLQALTKLDPKRGIVKFSSNTSLDDLIHKLVSFQLGEINPFDIIYIQRFLIAHLNSTANKVSFSHKSQFIWLNDILSKLPALDQAKLVDPFTFATYFKRCLAIVVSDKMLNNQTEETYSQNVSKPDESGTVMSSNYLTSVFVSSSIAQNKTLNSDRLVCFLDKYALTQQIYFRCYLNNNSNNQLFNMLSTRIELDSNLTNYFLNRSKKAVFILFENLNLFPNEFYPNSSFADLSKNNRLISLESSTDMDSNENNNQIASQIFALASHSIQEASSFNITLEIKMPSKYYRLLAKIESKLVDRQREIYWKKPDNNSTNGSNFSNSRKIYEYEKNPFDQIFTGNVDYTVVDSQNFTVDEADQLELNDSAKLINLRNNLINRWFSIQNYELNYTNLTQPMSNLDCTLLSLEFYFKLDNDFSKPFIKRSENSYRLFGKISCKIKPIQKENETTLLKYQFISLRNVYNPLRNDISNNSFHLVINMIDEYMTLFNLNEVSLFSTFRANYRWFEQRIVYFSSVTSALLLLSTISSYLIARKSLLMPRSFFHVLINTWLCILLLILAYIFGINQVSIAYVCLPTALLLHYLTLCTSVWYTLYFYSLFMKLNTLKKRNYKLIFNLMANEHTKKHNEKNNSTYKALAKKKTDYDDDEDDEEDEEYVAKPVGHLYLLGWGLPLLIVSIIVSIAKRDYLTTPFSHCFTNETNILITSVIVPVLLMLIVKFVFTCLIWFTLKKILKDLKNDANDTESNETASQSNIELKEKLEMCQNWTNNRDTVKQQEQDIQSEQESDKPISKATSLTSVHSNRTSVMDAQHKPDIQLKLACCSVLLYLIAWSIAGLYAISPRLTRLYLSSQTANKIESFKSNEFYVNDCLKKVFIYLFSMVMFVFSMLQISFYVLSRDDIIIWKKKQKNNYLANRNRSSCLTRLLEFFYNKKNKIRKMSESSSISSSNNNNNDNVVTVNEKNSSNWYFDPPEIVLPQSDPEPEPANQKKDVEEIHDVTDANNQHRDSICDVLFSAKKALSSTSVSKSNDTSDNELKEEEEEELLNKNQTNLMPTLATQEETSETYTENKSAKELHTNEEENPYSKCSKKSFHVRNPSVLSGSIAQNIQILNGSHFLNENTSINTSRNSNSKTLTSKQTKKPPYVFVDYRYEENILKSCSQVPSVSSPSTINHQELKKSNTPNRSNKKNKFNDLLTNSCQINTGTAIDSIPDIIDSSTSQGLHTCLMLKNKLEFKAANSNGSESATTSLSVSSSNTGSSINFNANNNNQNLINELNDCAQIYLTNVSNRSSQLSSSAMIYQSSTICNFPRKVNDSSLRNTLINSNKLDLNHETSV